jgi:hypothetical protein
MPDYAKKLREDLKAAKKLLKDAQQHPSEVFLKYGLVDKPEGIKYEGDMELACGCGKVCGLGVEASYKED